MNPLVKKEIRLVLPGCLAVLALEVLQPWLWNESDTTFAIAPVFLFFGIILLSVDTFGREFSLGTFQTLLSQPVDRRRIWGVKIWVLFGAAALVFVAYLASCGLRLHDGLRNPLWHANPKIIETDFLNSMFASGLVLLVALAGGLWTSLLLRQIASAFWITFLAPATLLITVEIFISQFFPSTSEFAADYILFGSAAIYSILAFWLAHRLFHRAQDVGWSGGVISFSKWRYFESGSKTTAVVRRWKPVIALLKKESQLQSITFFCACALLALHIGVFVLRGLYANFHRNSFADGVSEFFWMLWVVMPLVIGGTAVAEERKLGVTEQQFCLPVSRRAQFLIKFIITLFFGMLLGGFMPLFLETLAAHLSLPIDFFKPDDRIHYEFGSPFFWFKISIMGISAGLSLVAFFASTLAKNFMQALSISIVIIIGCCLFGSFIQYICGQNGWLFGIMPWPSPLPVLIGIPTVATMCLWLVHRNFCRLHEGGRLWRCNVLALVGAVVFVFVSSAVIFNRAWDVFEPLEPAHGPAIYSLSNPPQLTGSIWDLVQIRLPDGQVWLNPLQDYQDYGDMSGPSWKMRWRQFKHLLPEPTGVPRHIPGSNWVSVVSSYSQNLPTGGYHLQAVGTKVNGSLWLATLSKTNNQVDTRQTQLGNENDWRQVSYSPDGILFLKNNGTLWQWGDFRWRYYGFWDQNPAPKIQQVDGDSDWKELFAGWPGYVRKEDGSVWVLNREYKNLALKSLRFETNLTQVVFQTLSDEGNNLAYVRPDGTLWVGGYNSPNGYPTRPTFQFQQVGAETNWVAVALSGYEMMVALKSDGSLWRWHFQDAVPDSALHSPPTRLGIHNDWVAISNRYGAVIALAADGSLWLWPDRDYFSQMALQKLPKQPRYLGRVLETSN